MKFNLTSKIILAILILALFVGISYLIFKKNQNNNVFTMPLSGKKVSSELLTQRKPFAVIVENTPESRPQSGLTKADLVFEEVTEGGITRMLAFFQTNEPTEIGPVRSARSYFVDWATGFDSILVHFGGSPVSLEKIKRLGLSTINGIDTSNAFRRDRTRKAPHNAYTSYKILQDTAINKNYEILDNIPSFIFKDELKLPKRPKSQQIIVNFSTTTYQVTWDYDTGQNSYIRSINGEPQVDRRTGISPSPKNVIIIETTSLPNNTTEEHTDRTTGSGQATYFIDGKTFQGKWTKETVQSPVRFLDNQNRNIKLNRGQTWVEVITPSQSFNVSL